MIGGIIVEGNRGGIAPGFWQDSRSSTRTRGPRSRGDRVVFGGPSALICHFERLDEAVGSVALQGPKYPCVTKWTDGERQLAFNCLHCA
jgi:hypothetical protein